jgi:hypothetical protein
MIRVDHPFDILLPSILFWFIALTAGSASAQPQMSNNPSTSSQQSSEQILMTVTVTDGRNRVIGKLAKSIE